MLVALFFAKINECYDEHPQCLRHSAAFENYLPCLERAGLRRFRFHDLRHTFGSLLIQDGATLALCERSDGSQLHQVTVDTCGI
jgi:integrase